MNSILGSASDTLGVENPINKLKPPRSSSQTNNSATQQAIKARNASTQRTKINAANAVVNDPDQILAEIKEAPPGGKAPKIVNRTSLIDRQKKLIENRPEKSTLNAKPAVTSRSRPLAFKKNSEIEELKTGDRSS